MAERLDFMNEPPLINAMEVAEHVARYSIVSAQVSGRRVLDIACGEGYGSWLMKEWGASEVVGVDVSDEAISSAKRNFSRSGVSYIQGDACIASQLLMGKKFDVIVSFETIEHLADPQKFLSEIRNLCEENSSIFISCPNDHIALPPDQSNPYHLRKYRFEEFVSETEQILGKASQWHFGVNVQGYALIPSDEPLLSDEWTELKSLVKVKPIAVAQLLPSQINTRPDKSNILYWGLGC
jgi:cyclopropane fatty-acyl-phospholipid synthase-like methyltransferase